MDQGQGFAENFLRVVQSFSSEEKIMFERIYRYWETRGELIPPKEMTAWIESNFGSVDKVKVQDFIKITNIILHTGAIFNELRMQRPMVIDSNLSEVIKEIEKGAGGPFAHPLTGTPEDTFGRIKGKYCITASNITKYDGLHGLVIFDEHNPLNFASDRIRDYFEVALKWFDKAHKTNEKAVYPFFTWNCLWNAGSSIIHGHAQVAITEGQAYARVEEIRYHTLRYQERYKSSYFDDDYYVHEKLGLAFKHGDIRIMASITPIKEKEIVIHSPAFDATLADFISTVLTTYNDKLGVITFNMAVMMPPMAKTPEVWEHFPVIVKIVDRGNLSSKTADIGAMELYAQSVVGSNPYNVINAIKSAFNVSGNSTSK